MLEIKLQQTRVYQEAKAEGKSIGEARMLRNRTKYPKWVWVLYKKTSLKVLVTLLHGMQQYLKNFQTIF